MKLIDFFHSGLYQIHSVIQWDLYCPNLSADMSKIGAPRSMPKLDPFSGSLPFKVPNLESTDVPCTRSKSCGEGRGREKRSNHLSLPDSSIIKILKSINASGGNWRGGERYEITWRFSDVLPTSCLPTALLLCFFSSAEQNRKQLNQAKGLNFPRAINHSEWRRVLPSIRLWAKEVIKLIPLFGIDW